MTVETRRIEANGLSFAVDVAGDGDTVALLLHGFPESRAAWGEQFSALTELGWRVAAPDLRGYGQTTRPTGRDAYRIAHLVDDVMALFDALGARRRILVGHDWGGVIAWQVAIRRPNLLDGLVILNAPHPAVYQAVYRRQWRQMLRSWYVLFFLLPALPERTLAAHGGRGLAQALESQSRNFPPERMALYRRNIAEPGAAKVMIDYYRANALTLGTAPPPAPIATPTLMLWGEADAALDIALTRGNEAYVTDLTLHRLPGVSHWVQEDASPDVNRLIAAWAREKGLA